MLIHRTPHGLPKSEPREKSKAHRYGIVAEFAKGELSLAIILSVRPRALSKR